MKFLYIYLLIFALFWGGADLCAQDENFDLRAQEVVDGLSRHNGLAGWEPFAPSAWPRASFDDPNAGGAVFSRDVPAALTGLFLSNLKLGRGGDFSGLKSLLILELAGNDFRALNLLGNSALLRVNAVKNSLAALDPGQLPSLERLALSSNQLESLDLRGNPRLLELAVSMNRLSRLDVSQNPSLTVLEAMNNRLSAISVRENPRLARLLLSYNRLEDLYVGHNPALIQLGARDNRLESLDLRANPELMELTLSRNALLSLDLSANTRLLSLALDQNNIRALDLSANHELVNLQLQENPLAELRLARGGLMRLETLNVDGCRLPLSRLYPLSGLAKKRGRLGSQDKALFEEISLEYKDGEATLDLSAEAFFGGEATEFLLLTDKKRRVKPSEYRAENGVIHFKKPGRYVLLMTNPKVFSSDINQLTGRVHAIKAKVYSGLIRVVENWAPPAR